MAKATETTEATQTTESPGVAESVEPRRLRWSVPAADVSTNRWLDNQDNISVSLRLLIRESIQRDGYVDVMNQPVEQQPRRGRPPRTHEITDSGSQDDGAFDGDWDDDRGDEEADESEGMLDSPAPTRTNSTKQSSNRAGAGDEPAEPDEDTAASAAEVDEGGQIDMNALLAGSRPK